MPAIDRTYPAKPTKPRAPRRPSPTSAAEAQERYYASQGKAVERVANAQRATGQVSPPTAGPKLRAAVKAHQQHVAAVKQAATLKRRAARVQATRQADRLARQAETRYADLGRAVQSQADLMNRAQAGLGRASKGTIGAERVFGIKVSRNTPGREFVHQRTPKSFGRKGGYEFSLIGKTPTQLAEITAATASPNPNKALSGLAGLQRRKTAAASALPSPAAQKVLDIGSRPIQAIAGGTSAALKGENVLTAAGRGFTDKDRKTFSDVLAEHGVKGPVGNALGFVLDVGLDPTTYISLGSTSVAREAAVDAARSAAASAERAALRSAGERGEITAAERAAAKARGDAAAKTAFRRAQSKAELQGKARHQTSGVDVRLAGKRVPGVTRATGAARHAVSRAAAPVTERGPVQQLRQGLRRAGSEVNANVRAVGQTGEERATVKGLQRETRAEADRVLRRVSLRVRALGRRFSEDEQAQIIDAIESGSVAKLKGAAAKRGLKSDPDRLYTAARRIEDDLKHLRRVGRRSGLFGGEIGKGARSREDVELSGQIGGTRSTAPTRAALKTARSEQAKARNALRDARTMQEHADALEQVDATQQRVENLRARLAGTERKAGAEHAARSQRRTIADRRAASEAAGYVPRVRESELQRRGWLQQLAEPSDVPVVREQLGAATPEIGASSRREQRGTRAQARETDAGRAALTGVSENLPGTLAHYGGQVAKGAAARNLNARMIEELGKPLPRDISRAQLAELTDAGKSVYRVRGGALERLDPKSYELINAASKRTRAPGEAVGATGGRYAVLDDQLVARVRAQSRDLLSRYAAVQLLDAPTRGLRKLALAMPGYLVRNLAGDNWNAWGDESWWRLARNQLRSSAALKALRRTESGLQAFKQALPADRKTVALTAEQARQIGKALDLRPEQVTRKMPAEAVAILAERMGVIRQGRLVELADEGKIAGKLPKGKLPGAAFFQRAAQRVEDQTRLATFLGGLHRGLDLRQAAQRASEIHFDYNDLTTIEKTAFRRATMFYTFPARNLPLQAKRAITRPGKIATLAKAETETRKAAGLDPNYRADQDPYEATQLGFPIKWHGKTYTVSLGLPFTDLNDATSIAGALPGVPGDPFSAATAAGQRIAGMASPYPLKAIVEYATNHSFFYRGPIDANDKPTRAPAWVVAVAKHDPALRKRLGLTPDYAPPEGGKAWGWPRRTDYLLRQFQPGLIGAALNVPELVSKLGEGDGEEGANARGASFGQQILGYFGPRVRAFDRQQGQVNRAYDELDRIDKRLKWLRGTYVPGTQTKVSADTSTPEYTRLLARQTQLNQTLDGKTLPPPTPTQLRRIRSQRRATTNPDRMRAAEQRARRAARVAATR